MDTRGGYIIKCGEEGKSRLNVLAEVLEPYTRAWLLHGGSLEGMRFLDLGCGGGHVSMLASSLVGSGGHVTGIDFDPEILVLAEREAAARGVENISYRAMDASSLDHESEFDIAYSRFLLSHIQRPKQVLDRMIRSVKPGGRVIVEDIDFSGHFYHPRSEAFSTYVDHFTRAALHNGHHPDIGLELMFMFRAEPMLDRIECDMIQPFHTDGEGKWMAYLTMDRIRETILQQRVADADTLNGILSDLKKFTEDDRSIISLPRIFRVSGVRV